MFFRPGPLCVERQAGQDAEMRRVHATKWDDQAIQARADRGISTVCFSRACIVVCLWSTPAGGCLIRRDRLFRSFYTLFSGSCWRRAMLIDRVNNWSDAAALARTEKEALQRQRIELAQISTHAAQLSAENEQLRRLLNVADTVSLASVAVEVLYEPPNAFAHHLVFNKGTSSGIRPGMPVIDEGGIVGQVVRVTPFTSEAALLTDDKVSIPVQVLRNGLRLIAFGGNVSGKVEVRYLTASSDIRAWRYPGYQRHRRACFPPACRSPRSIRSSAMLPPGLRWRLQRPCRILNAIVIFWSCASM